MRSCVQWGKKIIQLSNQDLLVPDQYLYKCIIKCRGYIVPCRHAVVNSEVSRIRQNMYK